MDDLGVAVGLRERKKLKTREALESAALELFDRQGFEHTTVEEIAEACDVSPRTFFRYFPSKEAVLLGDADEKREELVTRLRARPGDEAPLRSIRESMIDTLAGLEHDRDRMLVQSRIMAESPALQSHKIQLQQSWDEALLDALLAREGARAARPSRFDLRLVASTAIAAMRAAVETWLEEGGDLVVRVDDAFAALARGFDPGGVDPGGGASSA
jgi:AcrR family transcriptional regulator